MSFKLTIPISIKGVIYLIRLNFSKDKEYACNDF